jgi:very-short-patch-repair endonuclease
VGVNLEASYHIMKNSNLKGFAQELRNNQTDAEKKIWDHLRQRQMFNFKFRRQQIIGIDGGQHNNLADQARTNFLEKEGYKILRF